MRALAWQCQARQGFFSSGVMVNAGSTPASPPLHGSAEQGVAGPGEARRGTEWQGKVSFRVTVLPGSTPGHSAILARLARAGEARPGLARQCKAVFSRKGDST